MTMHDEPAGGGGRATGDVSPVQSARGVAHDLNNVLGTIVGYAELLVEDLPGGSDEQDFAARIKDAARRGTALVEQLREINRRQQAALADPASEGSMA